MATLYVGVWIDAAQTLIGRPIQNMAVTIPGTSAVITAPANGKARRRVRLYADADCFVKWGTDPSATDGTDSIPLGADNPESFDIETGDKISVISRT